MINNCNINSFLSTCVQKEFTELSKSDKSHVPLVNNSNMGYDFDSISKKLFGNNKLKSADSIIVKKNTIIFIEFKSGFKKRIHKDNFDKSMWPCKYAQPYCSEGADFFLKNQDLTAVEMILGIQMKAIESFVTLEKFIAPQCFEENKNWNVKFIAVIDIANEIPIDMYEVALSELGDCAKETIKKNAVVSLKDSLKKYIKRDSNNNNNNNVLYDSVDVMTIESFNLAF